jgi:hypothetical protein
MRFFVGLHQPSDAKHFESAFISVNRLRDRKAPFAVGGAWVMDSAAFTEVSRFGGFRHGVEEYAAEITRWATNGTTPPLACVAQDYPCERAMLARTGLSVPEHQRMTIDRLDQLRALAPPVYVMPCLQGFAPSEYVAHVRAYGDRLPPGAWVGVGSVCKRNGKVAAVEQVLRAIKGERPDLRLHGFGLKATALGSAFVRAALHSADSMAWSFAARYEGRNQNDWREARAFAERIATMPTQQGFEF